MLNRDYECDVDEDDLDEELGMLEQELKAEKQIQKKKQINNVQPNQSLTIVEGNGILSTTSENFVDLSIYPNPSDAGIYKINTSMLSEIEVKIYTIQGKLVLNQLIEDKTIDLSSLASGVYVVQLNSGQQSIVKKLIKN